MGKAALILVAGIVLVSSVRLMNIRGTAEAAEETLTNYEETILARQIAESAYSQAVSNVRRQFDTWRETLESDYQGGSYTATASGPTEGPVAVKAVGRYGQATYEMNGTLSRAVDEFLDALTFDAKDIDLSVGGTGYTVSGIDVLPPSSGGGDGSGPDVHGIRSVQSAVHTKVLDKFTASRVTGVDGTGDMVLGAPLLDSASLMEEIEAAATAVYTSDVKFEGSATVGSPSSPVVLVVKGKRIEIKGNAKGYGVVLVKDNGEFKMNDQASWEGLVVVQSEKLVKMEKTTTLYGTMLLVGPDEGLDAGSDAGLPGGHFDVDVFDHGQKVYHEHEYDDKYDVTSVDLLSAGCKTNGGLCLEQIVGERGPLRVEFFNAGSSSGSFSLVADGTTYSGSPADGLNVTADPQSISALNVNFSSLCTMARTTPSNVQGDAVNRAGAFSVRMYDPATDVLVYELSVYWHYKDGDECDDDGNITTPSASFGKVRFEIKDQAAIHYSLGALLNLADTLPSLQDLIRVTEISQLDRSTNLKGVFTAE